MAVANALPALKERSDFVTKADHGAGVIELIEQLLADDLDGLAPGLERHALLLGHRDDGSEARIEPYGMNVLIAGTSGGGKSTKTTGLLERIAEAEYQYVVIDLEGDYSAVEKAVVLGDPQHAPTAEEVLHLITPLRQNAVVNLLGLALEHRPAFFQGLLPHLQELRARTGRPHWIAVDEAHHLLPPEWKPATLTLPRELRGMFFITVHPESVAPAVLESIDLLLAVGETPQQTIEAFCKAAAVERPAQQGQTELEKRDVLAWWRRTNSPPARIHTVPRARSTTGTRANTLRGTSGLIGAFVFAGQTESSTSGPRISSFSCKWLRASTTRRRATTSARRTTPPGSAMASKTRSWPTTSRRSNDEPTPRPRKAAGPSAKQSSVATRYPAMRRPAISPWLTPAGAS